MSIWGTVTIHSWKVPFQDLPAELKSRFTSAEIQAYSAGAQVILDALGETGEPKLVKLTEYFSSDQALHVTVDDYFGRPRVWFGMSSTQLVHHIRIQLASERQEFGLLPDRLSRLYRVVHGCP